MPHDTAPLVLANVPGPHAAQIALPLAAACVPGGHGTGAAAGSAQ